MTVHRQTGLTYRLPIDRLLGMLGERWLRDDRSQLVDRQDRSGRSPVARAHRFGHGDDGHHDEGDADDVLAKFRERAHDIHEQVVHDNGVFVVEFLGATGGGKTTLIERLIERAPDDEHIGVIVGDVAGDDDARRFREHGVEVTSVTTGKECHLDPGMLEDALAEFDLSALDRLYVENVGNMVCPADFPLGAQARVLVVSTTEGDDVVRKHPLLFEACDAAVINKTDIADAVEADVPTMHEDVQEVAPGLDVFETNARDEVGLDPLVEFLEGVRDQGHHHAHEHAHHD
jgi:hydrogenase nickel incorporation protein HypB